MLGFVNDLGQRIVAQIEPQPFIYRFRVIPNSTLNAFALPGGYIYFHSATILAGRLARRARRRDGPRDRPREGPPLRARHREDLLALAARARRRHRRRRRDAASRASRPRRRARTSRSSSSTAASSRAEADELGAVFMARAGFDPAGMGRFFERIVAADDARARSRSRPTSTATPTSTQRIDGVKQRAADAARLAAARSRARGELPRRAGAPRACSSSSAARASRAARPTTARASDPLLARANAAASAGRTRRGDRALLDAGRARRAERPAPPLPRAASSSTRAGRTREAIAAWRRAVALDPSVALAYYHLGDAYKALGDRHDAAYYFEQAERRFKPGGAFQHRAQLALQTLVLPAGHGGGPRRRPRRRRAETVAGAPARPSPRGDAEVVWWAKLDKRYGPLRRRACACAGATRAARRCRRDSPRRCRSRHVAARLALGGPLRERFGVWRVEAVLDGQVIDRRSFALRRRRA